MVQPESCFNNINAHWITLAGNCGTMLMKKRTINEKHQEWVHKSDAAYLGNELTDWNSTLIFDLNKGWTEHKNA